MFFSTTSLLTLKLSPVDNSQIIHISSSFMIRIKNCPCAFCHLPTQNEWGKASEWNFGKGREDIWKESSSEFFVCVASAVLFMSFINTDSSYSCSKTTSAKPAVVWKPKTCEIEVFVVLSGSSSCFRSSHNSQLRLYCTIFFFYSQVSCHLSING